MRVYCAVFLAVCVMIKRSLADECSDAVNIGDDRRSPTNVLDKNTVAICDSSLTAGVWYKFNSSIGNRMWDSCTLIQHCGTYAPIWSNGTHPTASDSGPVNRTVCAQYWPGGDCCGWSSQVAIKWCRGTGTEKDYYAYLLTPTPTCDMAYCVAPNYATTTTSSTSTKTSSATPPTSTPTTNFPTTRAPPAVAQVKLDSPYVCAEMKANLSGGAGAVNASVFCLKCWFWNTSFNLPDAQYVFVFEADGSTTLDRYTTNSSQPHAILREDKLKGNLGKSIMCFVSSYWNSQPNVISNPRSSNVVWIGIQPVNESNAALANIRLQEGQVDRFKMQATFPLTSIQCFNTTTPCSKLSSEISFTMQSLNYKTPSGKIAVCNFRLRENDSSSSLIEISPVPTKGTRKENFAWVLSFVNVTDNQSMPSLFYGYQISNITVIINDERPSPMCHLTSRLHIQTFSTSNDRTNNRLYDIDPTSFHATQVYNFASATTRHFQIQIMQQTCGNSTHHYPFVCGVMVRENNNVVGINACMRNNSSGDRYNNSILFIRRITDYYAPSGVIVATGSGYTITMRSGVQIDVDIQYLDENACLVGAQDFFRRMYIYVTGLPSDQYLGLCSYDGIQTNCSTDCEKYRISLRDSFFSNQSNINDTCLPPQKITPLCNCTSTHDDSTKNFTCDLVDQLNQLPTSKDCNLGTGSNNRRRKRQTNTDQNLQKGGVTFGLDTLFGDADLGYMLMPSSPPVWPTPRQNISEETAYHECRKSLNQSAVYTLCQNLSYIDIEDIIRACVLDVQALDSLGPVSAVQSILERLCVYAIESSMVDIWDANWTIADNRNAIEQAKQDRLNRVLSHICPFQCSGNGNCINGSCSCKQNFTGSDCATSSHATPNITYAFKDRCDVQLEVCRSVYLTADNAASGDSLKCDITNLYSQVKYITTATVSGSVIICSTDFDLGIYRVSLTNNGVTFSRAVSFMVYNGSYPMTPPATTTRNTKLRFSSASTIPSR